MNSTALEHAVMRGRIKHHEAFEVQPNALTNTGIKLEAKQFIHDMEKHGYVEACRRRGMRR